MNNLRKKVKFKFKFLEKFDDPDYLNTLSIPELKYLSLTLKNSNGLISKIIEKKTKKMKRD